MHTEHEEAIEALHSTMIRRSADGMAVVKSAAGPKDVGALNNLDELLWQAVIACQNNSLRTASGLPFSYTVKRKKDGTYSGELLVSRKEGSKTLTKSSVLLAFHKVLADMEGENTAGREGGAACSAASAFSAFSDSSAVSSSSFSVAVAPAPALPEYKGPKSIGQIFGISYVYSLFWYLGLIRVPAKIEEKLKCRE